MKSLVTTIAALTISLGLISGDASAGHRKTVHDLAYSLKSQTARAAREVRYGFRHTPQYRDLYKDVYDMYCEADHLYRISHRAVSNAHVLEDIAELDELMHHTQELVAELSATFMSAELGITVGLPANHQQYLIGWLQIMKGDKNAIITAASQAQKVVDFIIPTTTEEVKEDDKQAA